MKRIFALTLCVLTVFTVLCSCKKEEPLADSAKIYYSYNTEALTVEAGDILDELLYMFASMETELNEDAVIDISSSFNVTFYLDGSPVAVFYVDEDLVFSDGSHNCYMLKDGNYFDYGRLCDIYTELSEAK
ncbi:MAG: hypothetical protein E7623_00425 [Ruminococcaceae bacterium]|nr:hypothetical protein [Oscillospiraceae bacterium]